ncbi:MAG: outer membrane protein assembly factor BamA [Lentisphaeria bacterium]|nr:outer membrane protein assembly factor BamA [Lentisphaeria bacterium]
MKLTNFIFLLGLLAWQAEAAQISELKFVQSGAGEMPETQLLQNVRSKAGTEYNQEFVSADVKRLHETGYFSDVKSTVNKLDGDQIEVIFELEVMPHINKVSFLGNKKYKDKKLYEQIVIYPDMPYRDKDLQESADKLREFYSSEGYKNAVIIPKIEKVDGGLNIVFNIDEQLRLRVDNVKFEGATVFSQFKLKHAIGNRYSFLSKFLDFGLFDPDELDLDKARLRELYWNKGYLDFQIEDIAVEPDAEDPELLNITFKIYEGEPYQVGTIKIVGNKAVEDVAVLEGALRLKSGETFTIDGEDASRKAIMSIYDSMGYAKANCRVDRDANAETHTVDLIFDLDEGHKYEVDRIIISGNDITKEKVVLREMLIAEGDPVDRNRIEASKDRLMGMGIFNKVEMRTVDLVGVDKQDIEVLIEEKQNYNFRVGGGFSTEDSLVGMVELSNPNFDITNPGNWFRGGGQRFRIQAIAGLERMAFNVDFSEPWLFDMPLRLDTSLYLKEAVYSEWAEDHLGVKLSLSRKILDDFTTVSVGYKFEYVEVKDFDHDSTPEMRALKAHDLVSQFSLQLARDTRDSMMEPTEGYFASIFSAVSPKILGSTVDFYKIEAKGSYYYPILDKALIFHVGGKIGTVANFDFDKEVGVYERYFLGGGDSVRGFSYRSISPVDSRKKNLGGQSVMVYTAEMTHPIWNFIRGAVFCDVGNVWARAFEYSFSDLNIGAGYGLRIKVPYINAPMRLDLAYPIVNNQKGEKSTLRFHFDFGFSW